MDSIILFSIGLFFIAILYASVGHGGATGYLALMALFSYSAEVMKPTALILNILVSLIAFIHFYRARYYNLNIFWPLALASVPMAFLGGLVITDGVIYQKLLGLLLMVPVIRFLFFNKISSGQLKESNRPLSILIGGSVGFLSGLLGIGGGILLSPVLLLLKWANQKQAAAISALFIFVNSVSGLAGQVITGISFTSGMMVYVLVTLAGGFLGSYLGALKFRQTVVKNALATVLMVAVIKLLFTTM